MKKEYIQLLTLLSEFKCKNIIPAEYLREVDEHINFLKFEISNTIEREENRSQSGLFKIFDFFSRVFKGT